MKRFRNTIILSMLLALTLCVGAQATENTMLKVGLKYGSDALFTARLQNYNDTLSGSGYEFGYYDADRSFVPLAVTDEQKITVTVDSNAYVSGGVCYETRPTNYSTILGAYHIELLTAFGSYEEALAAAQSYPKGFVAYIDGAYRVRVGNHASYDESARELSETDVLAYGAQIVTPSSTGVVVSVTDTDTVLFEFDCSGLRSLGVRPRSVSGEKTVTWFSGYRYYGGFEYQRTTGGYISVINVLDIEDYVKCVIAAEMSNDWPLEALKAQTVCARTYAAAQTRHRSAGFDVCSTVDCQAYKGAALSNERSDAAAEETRGVYLYYNGELVTNAVYYSCNGGSILMRQASRGASPATTGRSLRPATSCARCSSPRPIPTSGRCRTSMCPNAAARATSLPSPMRGLGAATPRGARSAARSSTACTTISTCAVCAIPSPAATRAPTTSTMRKAP